MYMYLIPWSKLFTQQKSTSGRRADAAKQLLESVESHHGLLVEQAALVAEELIRIAILWHEEWYEALEEASRLYFGEGNVEGMFRMLQPLHDRMAKIGPSTQKEIAFVQVLHALLVNDNLDFLFPFCLSWVSFFPCYNTQLYRHMVESCQMQLRYVESIVLQIPSAQTNSHRHGIFITMYSNASISSCLV